MNALIPHEISSVANPRVKHLVRLRQRSHRDECGETIVEGYREVNAALNNGHAPTALYVCRDFFQGSNNETLLARAEEAGADVVRCTASVFEKISYRDRPDGLLAVAPQVRHTLSDITLRDDTILVVAESIEKPGNLGTMLRSCDASGVSGVIICDRCTDINNPNVVRASVGTLFALPVVETSSADVIPWLRDHHFRTIATTPHAEGCYTDVDLGGRIAVIMGTEQYGLSPTWLDAADLCVRIPMLGQADSLNVASATTLVLYEAVRQRGWGSRRG